MNPCVFLDRDGVLNEDDPNYVYELDRFKLLPGVTESLARLKRSGFLLVVVTNQSGISKGIYSIEQMKNCHAYLQKECSNAIDHFYFSPYHRAVTNSLFTKPDSLLFEKAISRFDIDVSKSWMIGDRGRDLTPARKLSIRTIQIGNEVEPEDRGDFVVQSLVEATTIILD